MSVGNIILLTSIFFIGLLEFKRQQRLSSAEKIAKELETKVNGIPVVPESYIQENENYIEMHVSSRENYIPGGNDDPYMQYYYDQDLSATSANPWLAKGVTDPLDRARLAQINSWSHIKIPGYPMDWSVKPNAFHDMPKNGKWVSSGGEHYYMNDKASQLNMDADLYTRILPDSPEYVPTKFQRRISSTCPNATCSGGVYSVYQNNSGAGIDSEAPGVHIREPYKTSGVVATDCQETIDEVYKSCLKMHTYDQCQKNYKANTKWCNRVNSDPKTNAAESILKEWDKTHLSTQNAKLSLCKFNSERAQYEQNMYKGVWYPRVNE